MVVFQRVYRQSCGRGRRLHFSMLSKSTPTSKKAGMVRLSCHNRAESKSGVKPTRTCGGECSRSIARRFVEGHGPPSPGESWLQQYTQFCRVRGGWTLDRTFRKNRAMRRTCRCNAGAELSRARMPRNCDHGCRFEQTAVWCGGDRHGRDCREVQSEAVWAPL